MLPLLLDQMAISISPNKLSMVRLRGLLGKHQVIAKHFQHIPTEKPSEANWLAVMDALNIQLKKSAWQNANVKIVISNPFVRYFLLPWSPTVLGEVEEQKFAIYKMEEFFGATPNKNWEITIGENAFGQSRLACAIESQLLSGLRQSLISSQLRIQSIEPHLTAALSYWKRKLVEQQFYFLLSDGEKLCVAHIKDGYLNRISQEFKNEPIDGNSIISNLNRNALMNTDLHGTTKAYIFSTEKSQFATTNSAYKLETLKLPNLYINQVSAFLAAAGIN